MVNLFGRRKNKRKDVGTSEDNYFQIDSVHFDKFTNSLELTFDREISIFAIKIIVNRLLPGNFLEQITFSKLNVELSYNHESVAMVEPYIYERIEDIEDLRYIKTDALYIHFTYENSSINRELILKSISLMKDKSKLFFDKKN